MNLFLFQQINGLALRSFWLDTFGIYFAKYLGYLLIFCLFLFIFKNFKKYKEMVLEALISAVFTRVVVVSLIRWILPNPRPFVENQVNLLLEHLPTSTFPSAHASFYFAIATIVYFYNKKAGIFFFIASFLIGISRVFCGIHWPLDVLAGIVVGILSALLIKKVSKSFKKQRPGL